LASLPVGRGNVAVPVPGVLAGELGGDDAALELGRVGVRVPDADQLCVRAETRRV
jgi:hypothetical protein